MPRELSIRADRAVRIARFLGRGVARVLVVGCNRGDDCRPFAAAGARCVVGLDIADDVGKDFAHRRVAYVRASAEAMPFSDASFDLVYSFATMEHVLGIEAAFREMDRVTAPGGIVYSFAAPLWNSRDGHHMGGTFPQDPWIHLRMERDEILSHCAARSITQRSDGTPIVSVVDYMLSPEFFNRRPAREYRAACAALPGMRALRNKLHHEPPEVLPAAILAELEPKGYTGEELRAVSHTYVGRRAGGIRATLRSWFVAIGF